MEESGELDSSQNVALKRKIPKTLVGKKKIRYFNSSKSIDRTLHRSKERVSSKLVISGLRANNRALAKMIQHYKSENTTYWNTHMQDLKEKHSLNLRICQLEQELNRSSTTMEYDIRQRFEEKLDLLRIALNKVSCSMADGVGYLQDAVNLCSSANSDSISDPAPDVSPNSINTSFNMKDGSEKSIPCSAPPSNSTSEHSISPDVGAAKKTIYDLSIIEESPSTPVSVNRTSCAKKSVRLQRSEMTSHPEEPNNQLVIPDGPIQNSNSDYSERCSPLSSNEVEDTALITEYTGIERKRDSVTAELEKNKLRRGTFVVLNSKQIAPWPPEKPADCEDRRPTFSTRAEKSLSPKCIELNEYPCQNFVSQRNCRNKSSKRSRKTSLECDDYCPPSASHLTVDKEATAQSGVNSTEVIEEKVCEDGINNTTTNNKTNIMPQDMELTAVVDHSIFNLLDHTSAIQRGNGNVITRKAKKISSAKEEIVLDVHKPVETTARLSGEMLPTVIIERCLVRNSEKYDALDVLKPIQEATRLSVELQPKVVIERCLNGNSGKKSDLTDAHKPIEEATRLSVELQPTVVIERCLDENNEKKSDLTDAHEVDENVEKKENRESIGRQKKRRKGSKKMKSEGRKSKKKAEAKVSAHFVVEDSDDDKEIQTKRRREDETDQIPVTKTSLSPNNEERVTRRGRNKNVVNYKLPLLSTKMRNVSDECIKRERKKPKKTDEKKKSKKH